MKENSEITYTNQTYNGIVTVVIKGKSLPLCLKHFKEIVYFTTSVGSQVSHDKPPINSITG